MFSKIIISKITFALLNLICNICLKNPFLGPISVNKTEVELDWVEKKYPEIQRGGIYIPPNCTARHRVAIIVPYRLVNTQ